METPLSQLRLSGEKPELGPNLKPCHDYSKRDTLNNLFPSSCYNPPENLIKKVVARFTNKINHSYKNSPIFFDRRTVLPHHFYNIGVLFTFSTASVNFPIILDDCYPITRICEIMGAAKE